MMEVSETHRSLFPLLLREDVQLWIYNILSGAIMASLGSCCGPLSPLKARGIALLSGLITLFNGVNLIILEAGEWRAFLSEEDKAYIQSNDLGTHMAVAYYATTICTVLSLVSSLLGLAQVFLFIKAKKETSIRELFSSSNLIESTNSKFSTLTDLTTDLVQNHGTLNLKTPAGPQPHPSWVYRSSSTSNNNSTVGSGVNNVKRSMSYLGGKSHGGEALYSHGSQAIHQGGTLRKSSGGGIQSISENVSELLTTNFTSKYNSKSPQKTAQIRRHQSMYINPSTFLEHNPSTSVKQSSSNSQSRRVSHLKRSVTSAGAYPSSHYAAYRRFKENYRKLQGGDSLFCEFQAGKSFDLPDPNKLSYNRSQDLWADGTPSCIMMTTYDDDDEDRDHSPSSDDSCRDNIRYQAINGLLQDSRHLRRNDGHIHRYSSLEDLLKDDSLKPQGLARYNSTGSISSAGSAERKASLRLFPSKSGEETRRSQMTQTPSSIYSLESKTAHNSSAVDSEEDRPPMSSSSIYDVPRKRNASLKKSNSRVSSSGKLRLRVESFKETSSHGQLPHTSSMETQTDGKYTGQFGAPTGRKAQQHQQQHNGVPPKPIRKYKPPPPPAPNTSSERSNSPDNSSTSGYSSPSAASKEASNAEDTTITVIQIVPTKPEKRVPPFLHRELPRIATNGTLVRPMLQRTARKASTTSSAASEFGNFYTTLPRRSEARLPPVPESSDKSDQERSISPAEWHDKSKTLDSGDNIEEKLKVLLHLMNQNESLCNKTLPRERGGKNSEEAVEYLAQLESVARRLKDHYLHKAPPRS